MRHFSTVLSLLTEFSLYFLDDQGIELIRLGTERTSQFNSISEDVVLTALNVILDTRNYPMCLMCDVGRHRSGVVVGCLRKLQRWNLTAIFEEYRRYAGSKVRLINEQFIELFDTDQVQIPTLPPKWL